MRGSIFTGKNSGSRKKQTLIFYLWLMSVAPIFFLPVLSFYRPVFGTVYVAGTFMIALHFFLRNLAHRSYEYRFIRDTFTLEGKETWMDPISFKPDETSFKKHVVVSDKEIVSIRATTPNILVWSCFRKSRRIDLLYRLSGGEAYHHHIGPQSIETDATCSGSSVAAALLTKIEVCLGTERIENLASWQQAKRKSREVHG